jgi:hypothetical protein
MRNDSMEADIKKPRKNVYSFLFKKFAQVRYEYLNEKKNHLGNIHKCRK